MPREDCNCYHRSKRNLKGYAIEYAFSCAIPVSEYALSLSLSHSFVFAHACMRQWISTCMRMCEWGLGHAKVMFIYTQAHKFRKTLPVFGKY